MNKKVLALFVMLLVVGAMIRVIAGTQSLGFVHPDEHQQYLEAANRIAYGYGVTFWEYERGIRHYLYPGFLAAILKLLDVLGVHAPVPQAQVIRTLMGLAVFGSLAAFSLRWLREGKLVAGLSLLAMAGLSP